MLECLLELLLDVLLERWLQFISSYCFCCCNTEVKKVLRPKLDINVLPNFADVFDEVLILLLQTLDLVLSLLLHCIELVVQLCQLLVYLLGLFLSRVRCLAYFI